VAQTTALAPSRPLSQLPYSLFKGGVAQFGHADRFGVLTTHGWQVLRLYAVDQPEIISCDATYLACLLRRNQSQATAACEIRLPHGLALGRVVWHNPWSVLVRMCRKIGACGVSSMFDVHVHLLLCWLCVEERKLTIEVTTYNPQMNSIHRLYDDQDGTPYGLTIEFVAVEEASLPFIAQLPA
jgi:hypothetical protein